MQGRGTVSVVAEECSAVLVWWLLTPGCCSFRFTGPPGLLLLLPLLLLLLRGCVAGGC